MIRRTVGRVTIEIPDSFEHDGELISLSQSSIVAITDDDGDAVGFELSYEIPGGGTIVNGIYEEYGDVVVLEGPLNEPEEYEHPDDAPYDTLFLPPEEFIDQISIYKN
ncbi:hypothetical protein [Aeromonas enteropelogenes]|uniref:hypothetical protein n=1 Tax=Aeromonas enteropelogenes TaxID=29489 RepID=UPI0012E04CBF|nr:hypothetical protein [Aeromonas enteropelogenes]UBH52039.1 hypothetical protein LA321_18775 [Aeromonas enteropelogenes]